jgi:NAD(P)-dependent dehydrogenase (short-subunit alcohol dehydrogenase family)
MTAQKIVCITGGGRGIGAATAKLAAKAGYSVCLSYLKNREAAQKVAAEILSSGGKAIAVQADVSVEADVIRMFERIDASLGRLTALVNNAGIVEPQARLKAIDAERLKRVFATNVFGSFICAREAVRRMSTTTGGTGGAIVNVSSRAAVLGSATEYIDYAASKGAIDTFTVGLAKEVAAEGIRVNAVRPGLIDTDMHASGGEPERIQRLQSTVPMQRGGTAEEVARTIVWLLSDEASYVTGTLVDVSGGR